jgi:hypothetical protein
LLSAKKVFHLSEPTKSWYQNIQDTIEEKHQLGKDADASHHRF